MDRYIYSSGAFSITRQSEIASRSTGIPFVRGRFNPLKYDGISIIFGNPSWNLNMLIYALKHTKIILYMTTEGVFKDNDFKKLYEWLKFPIYANSKFAKAKIEESGYHVEGVIYHEIDTEFKEINTNRTNKYLYVSGYLKRKYPERIYFLLDKISKDMIISTTLNNPYLRYFKFKEIYVSPYEPNKRKYPVLDNERLKELYNTTMFYTNLSDAEGFGLTVAEAMSYGVIPVAVKHPVFVELYEDCPYYVDYEYITNKDYFPPIYIEHYVYSDVSYYEILKKAKWDINRATKCQEIAKKFRFRSNYRVLLEL